MSLDQTDYQFADLVDISAFSRFLESFFKATGIPSALIDQNGEILCKAGWVKACTEFHRANPMSNRRCLKSNLELMQDVRTGKTACARCHNKLLNYATPVIVDGRHLASLFCVQALDEPPDMDYFRDQAAKFDYNESEYLDAIRAIPVIDQSQIASHMDCMVEMAKMLAACGSASLRQSSLEADLSRSTQRHIELQDILDAAPIGIGWSDVDGTIDYVNREFTNQFGYTLEDLPDVETWYRLACPCPEYREGTINEWRKEVLLARTNDTRPPVLETNLSCKDGSERRVLIHTSWVGRKRLVNVSDITDRWKAEQRNRAYGAMLEMVAKGVPLSDILHAIVHTIEVEDPSSLCSILLMDADGKHLLNGSAPSLPDYYNEAIHGIEIGMGVGSCGTAAYLGKRVIIEDIMAHEYWRPYAKLAKKAGLGSCWSEPIFSSKGEVLGTFAIYHRKPVGPSTEGINRIVFAANVAAIAIENRRTREELIDRERAFRSLAENAPDNIARYDREGRLIYANPQLEKTLNAPLEKMKGLHPSEHDENEERSDYIERLMFHVLKTGETVHFEVNVPTSDGMNYHALHMVAERDDSGAIAGVLVIGHDITDLKRIEHRLTASEREFRSLAEHAPINIARFDSEERLIYVNPKLAGILAVPIDRILGKRLTDVPGLRANEQLQNAVMHTLNTGEEISFESEIQIRKNRVETHIVSMIAERDESNAIIGVLSTSQDITQRKRLEKELEQQAHFDYLTGLTNRRQLIEQAENELFRLKRYGGEFSLIMFDIDHFKQFNDLHGHDVGDLVLQKIADISRETMRATDTVGRLGGEEFIVLLSHTGKQQAIEAAERLRAALAAERVTIQGSPPLEFTASFGVTSASRKNSDIDTLLVQADKAHYRAKQAGRNRVCVWGKGTPATLPGDDQYMECR